MIWVLIKSINAVREKLLHGNIKYLSSLVLYFRGAINRSENGVAREMIAAETIVTMKTKRDDDGGTKL